MKRGDSNSKQEAEKAQAAAVENGPTKEELEAEFKEDDKGMLKMMGLLGFTFSVHSVRPLNPVERVCATAKLTKIFMNSVFLSDARD